MARLPLVLGASCASPCGPPRARRSTRLPAELVLTASMIAMAALTLSAAHAKSPDAIAAAIADPNRPDADKQRDANRKPAETLAFAGVKPGDRVAELFPGGGYFTRLFSKIVGAGGH